MGKTEELKAVHNSFKLALHLGPDRHRLGVVLGRRKRLACREVVALQPGHLLLVQPHLLLRGIPVDRRRRRRRSRLVAGMLGGVGPGRGGRGAGFEGAVLLLQASYRTEQPGIVFLELQSVRLERHLDPLEHLAGEGESVCWLSIEVQTRGIVVWVWRWW